MPSIFRAPLLTAVVLVASGCGAGDSTDAAQDVSSESATASATPTPTPTPTPRATSTPSPPAPLVSLKTSCQLVFTTESKGPLDEIVDFVIRDSDTPKQLKTAQRAIDEIRQIATTSQPELSAQLAQVADRTQEILDSSVDQDGESYDVTPIQAAGGEAAQICIDAL